MESADFIERVLWGARPRPPEPDPYSLIDTATGRTLQARGFIPASFSMVNELITPGEEAT